MSIEGTLALRQFIPKIVRGLYNYDHFERSDGAWFQVSVDRRRTEVIFCSKPGAALQRFPTITDFRLHLERGTALNDNVAEA
jgi:hypothetical protein